MKPITKHEQREARDRLAGRTTFRRRPQIDQIHADRALERSNREVWDL